MPAWLAEQSQFLVFAGAVLAAFLGQFLWLRKMGDSRMPWLVWFLAALLLFHGWRLAEQAGTHERQRIQTVTEGFARLYADEMEKRGHWKLPTDVAADDPLYLSLIETEKGWLALNLVVNDIYTLRKLPSGKNVFIVDSETDYDRNGKYEGEREKRTPVGEAYEVADAGLELAFRGKTNFGFEPVTDRWGTWVSAFVPLHDAAGRPEAVLGVDFDADEFAHHIAAAKQRVIGLMALVEAVLFASSLLNAVLRRQIAERKEAEEKLRRSEERQELALSAADLGLWDWNVPSGKVVFDVRWCAMLGYRVEELEPKVGTWRSLIHPDDACRTEQILDRHLRGETAVYEAEFRMQHEHGHWVWILAQGKVVELSSRGAPIRMAGTHLNISARKEAEAALQAAMETQTAILDALPAHIALLDPQGHILAVNENWRRFASGNALRSPDFLVGQNYVAVCESATGDCSSEARHVAAGLRGVLEGGRCSFEIEYPCHSPEEDRWFRLMATPLTPGGSDGVVVMHVNVTERKAAEAALRLAELKFRGIVEQLPAITYHAALGETGVWSYVSPQVLPLLGYTQEEWLVSDRLWFQQIHPEDRSIPIEAEKVGVRTGRMLAEYRMFTRTGELRWFRDQGVFVPTEAGAHTIYGVMMDITEVKAAEAKLAKAHRELLGVSRAAGMAEVATSVLHNVGNVLNSVNVSASVVTERARESKVGDLARVVTLLDEHAGDLGAFISSDRHGKNIPVFLRRLSEQLAREQQSAITELTSLRENIEHIKHIVAMQQSYAKVSGVTEVLQVTDLIEDSLRLNADSLEKHGVRLVREYQEVPPVNVERHRVLQILVNLIRNAKYACDEAGVEDKQMTVRVSQDHRCVRVAVSDNGIGIPPENLGRIFTHGFTTRKDGHGFGLHNAVLTAQEMGGDLTVHSDGLGRGATFTLAMPFPTTSQP